MAVYPRDFSRNKPPRSGFVHTNMTKDEAEQMRHRMRVERKANRREKGNKLLSRCSNELTGMMPTYFMSMSDRSIHSVEHKKNVKGLLDDINIFLQGETPGRWSEGTKYDQD